MAFCEAVRGAVALGHPTTRWCRLDAAATRRYTHAHCTKMNCPRCKSGLVVVEYSNVELDWCPECGGLWFDSGEMELLARKTTEDSGEGGFCPSEPARTDEQRLKCPLCHKKMDKRLLGHPQPVIADVCPRCDGLWLDQGELEQVLGQSTDMPSSGDASDSILIEHLRGTFGEGSRYHGASHENEAGSAGE